MSGLLKIQNIFLAIIVIILLAALYSYFFSKTHWYDGMNGSSSGDSKTGGSTDSSGNSTSFTSIVTPDSGYKLQPITNPADLLPKDVNSQFSTLNPNVGSNNIAIPDLLEAGYHIGLDTIGQTLKNPNYDIRSAPLIPKAVVSPWNNSTIEPDIARVPLEIGQGLP